MTNINIVSFNSGEVTPEIDARKDIAKYTGGCRRLENMIPDLYGNATKRPGTEMIVVGNGAACYFEFTPDPSKIGISTPQELQDINNDLDGDYELVTNIDLAGFDWSLIGQGATPFTGTLDGNYFTISNLTMTLGDGENAGIFQRIVGGTVQRLNLKDFVFQGLGSFGALSVSSADTTYYRCSATGSFTSSTTLDILKKAGGLVMNPTGTVGGFDQCWADVSFTQGPVDAFTNPGQQIGGLIGVLGEPPVADCYSRGGHTLTLETTRTNVGWGSFVGDPTTSSSISHCYATGLNPTYPMPDLAGRRHDPFSGYTAGTGTDDDNFWDEEVIGNPETSLDAFASGKTTAEMKTQGTYTNWDFTDVWEMGSDGYPRLQWENETAIRQVCQQVSS